MILFFLLSCKKEQVIDLYMPEVELISAETVALTTYNISYSISLGNKVEIDSAVLIFDDITLMSAPDITKRIPLTHDEKQSGTLRIKLDRLNHDYSLRIKLFSEEGSWLSNSKVIRSSKSIFKIYLIKDEIAKSFNDIDAIQNNTDTIVPFIIEFTGSYKPQTTGVMMNNKSLRHKIDFNGVLYTTSGMGSEVVASAYLPGKLPGGVYDFTVLLDSVSFPVDGRLMLLDNRWVTIGTQFTGRNLNDYSSFIVNDNLFLVEADPIWQPRLPSIWKFDLSTRTWLQKNKFPVPDQQIWEVKRYNLQYKNRGFVLVLTDISANIFEYNFENDSFSCVTTYPGQGRDIICFFIGDYLYAGCGRSNVLNYLYYYKDFWRYNMVSGSWERLSDAPEPFSSYKYEICSGGGKGYVYDGVKSDLWQFDPETGNWNTKHKFPGALRSSTKMAWLDNKIYLFGGATQKDCWTFSPETNSWTINSFTPAFPTGFVCTYQNQILMGLGRQSLVTDDNDKNIYSLVE
jgi:hypothetical protein